MPAEQSPTLSQVQAALTSVITSIQKTAGYSYDLPADHVYKISNQGKLSSQDAQDYPKILVALVSGQNQKGTAQQFFRSRRYAVTVILRESYVDNPDDPPVDWKSVADEARDLVQDIERAILNNSTLTNVIDNIDPTDFETDADSMYPEAVIVYYFDVTYRRQMG